MEEEEEDGGRRDLVGGGETGGGLLHPPPPSTVQDTPSTVYGGTRGEGSHTHVRPLLPAPAPPLLLLYSPGPLEHLTARSIRGNEKLMHGFAWQGE